MTTEVITTEVAGNTKTATFRSRAFHVVIHECDKFEDYKNDLIKLKSLTYMLAYKETAPTTGKEHIHVYLYFSGVYRYSQKLMNYKFHVEIARGSPQQNIAYISKDGHKIFEYGEQPKQGCRTVAELKEMNINDVPPQYVRIKKELDEEQRENDEFLNMLDEIEADELKAPKIFYLTGQPGKGKTYSAYKLALKLYNKNEICKVDINNNFFKFTGNKCGKCHIIEEFRPSDIRASKFLEYIDKYGFNANVKGGFHYVRPECVIICCVIPPTDIYKNEEINTQFTRRITRTYNLDYEGIDELADHDAID